MCARDSTTKKKNERRYVFTFEVAPRSTTRLVAFFAHFALLEDRVVLYLRGILRGLGEVRMASGMP